MAKSTDRSRLIKRNLELVRADSFINALGRRDRGRGIYVLYKKGRVIYVGLSTISLRTRLRKHYSKDRLKGKWDKFSFYQITKTRYIKDVESLLLRVIRPYENRVLGRFRAKYNLNKELVR